MTDSFALPLKQYKTIQAHLDISFQRLHLVVKLLSQLFYHLVEVQVIETQLVLILHLQFLHTSPKVQHDLVLQRY